MMQPATQIGILVASAGGAVATYYFTLRGISGLGGLPSGSSPKPLAFCIAVISFMALVAVGPFILVPFAALGIAAPFLLFIRFLIRHNIIQLPGPRRSSPPSRPESSPLLTDQSTTPASENQTRNIFSLLSTNPNASAERQRKKSKVIPIEIMEEARKSGMRGNRMK